MSDTDTMHKPNWMLGYEMEELRPWAQLFAQHDKPFVQGAFTKVKENAVAVWLHNRALVGRHDGEAAAAAIWHCSDRWLKLRDFTGEVRLELPPGTKVVERLAWLPGKEAQMETVLLDIFRHKRAVLQIWQEHQPSRMLAERMGFAYSCSKIRASSEIVGVWTRGIGKPRLQGAEELVSVCNLGGGLDVAELRELSHGMDYAQHYSSYNKRRSWTALALRGYADDPALIVKPSEMSRGWKREHPELMDAEPRNTVLWDRFAKALEPALEVTEATQFERIRLMRLDPGGELTRHADITDKNLGLADRKIARLHIPLETNDEVRFWSWGADGERAQAQMGEGELWYLDIRKPHAAMNGGDTIRTHLVVDAVCNWRLRHRIN